VLPEIISKEPLGPAVRQGDDEWFNIVKWTLMAMIQAEESGITQDNLEEMMNSDNPEIRAYPRPGSRLLHRRRSRPRQ
jgi:general L-amino acid transport system substrate-binding protein